MDKTAVIKHPIEQELIEFKEVFDNSLHTSNPLLKEVLSYIRRRNGKMMRPILALLVAKQFGNISPATYHAAATLEMLHTASLVHDDVVDESDERRGQPSVNSAYNNKISVLVGDYLLSTALHHAALTRNIDIVEAVARLGQNLSEGEILQLSNISNEQLSEEVYYEVIRKKTAVLFATCAQVGAMSAGATEEEVEMFRLFGDKIGICFQIKDDIFDYYDNIQIGKPTGNDMLEGKITLPAIYAINNFGNERTAELVRKIKDNRISSAEIAEMVAFTKEHGGIEYAEKVMEEYRQDALQILQYVKDDAIREALTAYLNYVIDRTI